MRITLDINNPEGVLAGTYDLGKSFSEMEKLSREDVQALISDKFPIGKNVQYNVSLFHIHGRAIHGEMPSAGSFIAFAKLIFAEKLREERRRIKATQTELAVILGVSFEAISKWERNLSVPAEIAQEGAFARLAKIK